MHNVGRPFWEVYLNSEGGVQMQLKTYVISVLLIVLFGFSALGVSAQTIGLYFDENGEQPFYNPNNLEYPSQIDLFCIAKNLDPNTGIDGWETRIGWSDSLIVNLAELYGQAINVGAFPNFVVGLATPEGADDGFALLAKLSVFALGPGEVFLSQSDNPSIPGAEVPLYTSDRVLGAFSLEYGGAGLPSAAIGSRISSPNSTSVVTKSRISSLEIREGVLFGLVDDQKSWIEMPRREAGHPFNMTPEQKEALRLVPVFTSGDPNKSTSGQVVFEDDFEGYVADSGVPFTPTSQNPKKFNSGSTEDLGLDCRVFWGVLSDSDNGTGNFAFASAAIGCDCTEWLPQGIGGTWGDSYYREGFDYSVSSELSLTPEFEFQLENHTYRVEFDCKTVDFWYDEDYLSIDFSYENNGTVIFGVGFIDYNMPWTSRVRFDPTFNNLPYYGVEAGMRFSFSSAAEGGSDYGGAYIDNVRVSAHDSDLQITSVFATDSNVDISEPIPVEVTISNNGEWDSGDFHLGYQFIGDETVHQIPVASIYGYGSTLVELSIPYPEQGKTYWEVLEKGVNFTADVNDVIAESNEDNNTYDNVSLRWEGVNPPVILVHGILGGGIEKGGTQIYGEDFLQTIYNMTSSDLLNRSEDTNGEYVATWPARVPNAYPPENGFLKDVGITVPVSGSPISGSLGSQVVTDVTMPVQGGMWTPLIERLTNSSSYPAQQFVLPETTPSGPHEQDLFLFNYDWRVDLNPSRASLNGSTAASTKLDSLITWIKDNHPGADQLTVVSHSMGGLLVNGYMLWKQQLGQDHGIRRWISLGSPFQGSEKAMATLFGEQGKKILGIPFLKKRNSELFRNFVSGWELLPTQYYDSGMPDLSFWPDHAPFVVGSECSWPCPQYPTPVIGNFWDMGEIISDAGLDGWRHNAFSRQYSGQYRDSFMSMNPSNRINNVETVLITGCNVPTFRGVVRYTKEYQYFHWRFPDPVYYHNQAHDIAFASGDGTVGQWSARHANVDTTKLRRLYADGVQHVDLIRDPNIADFLNELIRGHDTSSYIGPWGLWEAPPSLELVDRPWKITWHTDVCMWPDKESEMDIMPVALELIDRDTGKLLVGAVHSDVPPGPIPPGETWSFWTSLDPRFHVSILDDDIMIFSNCQETLNLRLRVVPGPELWDPAIDPPAKDLSNFFVLGHLQLLEQNREWQWPDYASPEIYLEFNSIGNYGFAAYADFQMLNGVINQNNIWPDLYVDADGDGWQDLMVSGVEPGEEASGSFQPGFSVHPNPFNGGTQIKWALSAGEARKIKIYDATGRVVRVLAVDPSKNGNTQFDGRGDNGLSLASGVYFVALEGASGHVIGSQKITVLK